MPHLGPALKFSEFEAMLQSWIERIWNQDHYITNCRTTGLPSKRILSSNVQKTDNPQKKDQLISFYNGTDTAIRSWVTCFMKRKSLVYCWVTNHRGGVKSRTRSRYRTAYKGQISRINQENIKKTSNYL